MSVRALDRAEVIAELQCRAACATVDLELDSDFASPVLGDGQAPECGDRDNSQCGAERELEGAVFRGGQCF
jgi:hypothetical protein